MTRVESTSEQAERDDARRRVVALAAISVATGACFARLAVAVRSRDTAEADEAVHEATAVPEEHPVRQAASTIAPAGKKRMYIPAAICASAGLLAAPGEQDAATLRSRGAGAGAMLLSAGVARGLNSAFDRWLPQPPPPPGHPPDRPVFPSGHAFGPAALSLVTAYVLARERLARPEITFPVALTVPLVLAGARMLEEKHWASDVLGGYAGAISLSAACLAAYEAMRLE
jgi:cytochrome c5